MREKSERGIARRKLPSGNDGYSPVPRRPSKHLMTSVPGGKHALTDCSTLSVHMSLHSFWWTTNYGRSNVMYLKMLGRPKQLLLDCNLVTSSPPSSPFSCRWLQHHHHQASHQPRPAGVHLVPPHLPPSPLYPRPRSLHPRGCQPLVPLQGRLPLCRRAVRNGVVKGVAGLQH